MSMRRGTRSGLIPVWKPRKWLPAVLVAAAGAAGVGATPTRGTAQQAPPLTAPAPAPTWQPAAAPLHLAAAQPPKVEPKAAAPKADPADEKKYTISFDKATWDQVLEWYATQSGLSLITTARPTGSVIIKPPPGQRYTLGEVTDILNEALLQQKFLLVRREKSFTVLPADEKIDSTQLPRVSLEELKKRGRTELVTVVIPLTHFRASDIGPEVERMLSRFGEVVALERFRQLVVRDMAGNLSRIHETIKSAEEEAEKPKK